MLTGSNVVDYEWAPNSSRLAYYADQTAVNQFDLFSNTPDGSDNVTLGGMSGDLDVFPGIALPGLYAWAPNSLLIAFVADRDLDDAFALYVVNPTDGTGRIRVSLAATVTQAVTGAPSWAPDNSRIAYLGDFLTDGTDELFTSSPTVANTSTRVNSNLINGDVQTGNGLDIFRPPAWAPDSSRIAYTARQSIDQREVYAGLPGGGIPTKLSGPLAMNGSTKLGADGEVWSPDTTTLTLSYRGDQSLLGRDELWVTTTTPPSQLTTSSMAATGLRSFALWAPDGSQLIYVSEEAAATKAELFMTSADGSNRQKISGELIAGGNVNEDSIAWAH
jgi:Tol biopolymer transport system component